MENQNLDKLVTVALSYVGVTEVGGDNRGSQVEKFQKAVDGKAQGEPWCAAYVFFCLKQISEPHGLFESEHCMTVWNKSDKSRRSDTPKPGYIAIWQYYKNLKPTASGHMGICVSDQYWERQGFVFETVEGNTGPSQAVEREGDGVYNKKRTMKGTSSMKLVGFLRPF